MPAAVPPPIGVPQGDMLAVAHRLAELYQMVFPQKKKWLKKRLYWQEDKLMADMQTFYNRVTRHHFPLLADILDCDLDTGDWLLWHMPLALHGFYADMPAEWDCYEEPIPLLLKLAEWECLDEEEQVGLAEAYGYEIPPDFCLHQVALALDRPALPPLAALPDLVRMALGDTGNAWLDYSVEYMMQCNCYPEWEDFEEWRDEWLVAKPILAAVDQLTDWVQTNRRDGLDQVMALLLTAHEQHSSTAAETDDTQPDE